MTVHLETVLHPVLLVFEEFMLMELVNHVCSYVANVAQITMDCCCIVPADYAVGQTADAFFGRVENTVAAGTAVINYTVVMNNAHFNNLVLQARLSIVDTPRTETYFRLSNNETSNTYALGNPGLVMNGPVTIIRESVIISVTPVPVDVFDFEIRAIALGPNGAFGLNISRGVVIVTESAGKVYPYYKKHHSTN